MAFLVVQRRATFTTVLIIVWVLLQLLAWTVADSVLVCFKISSGLRLLSSLFHHWSCAPLATSGGEEMSCRGKTDDGRWLFWLSSTSSFLLSSLTATHVCAYLWFPLPRPSLLPLLVQSLPESYEHSVAYHLPQLHLWRRYFFELLWRGSEWKGLGKERSKDAYSRGGEVDSHSWLPAVGRAHA